MAKIRLFVCCHKTETVPKHPLVYPIQVGATLADRHFPGFLHDDTGENISEKNRSYCELTAQYWAWKNIDADYYGFFHYRRYLYPDKDALRPYQITGKPTPDLLNQLGYDNFANLIEQYDLVIPKGENMFVSVREHYAQAPFHHKKDLDLAERLVQENYPEMTQALEKYFSGTVCYFGNIFIMSCPVFQDYCAWLFSILSKFDSKAYKTNYSEQEQRVNGYLAERLLGVYFRYQKEHTKLRTIELPRIQIVSDLGKRIVKRTEWRLLPPGTRWRAAVKSLFFKR